jgi:hypothetical protein
VRVVEEADVFRPVDDALEALWGERGAPEPGRPQLLGGHHAVLPRRVRRHG